MQLQEWLNIWLAEHLDAPHYRQLVATAILASAIIVLSLLANYIAKRFIVRAVAEVIRRTETTWDDVLLRRHVFDNLSHLAPGMVIYISAPAVFPELTRLSELTQRGALIYMTIVTAMVIDSFLSAVSEIYEGYAVARHRPIKSYLQVVKIVVYVLTTIFLISSAIGESPVVLLGSIGALSAVLMLLFKDSILGLVASIQLSAQDMVRGGDWIEVPKYGADGDVMDISLTTVKVRNWDKTISTIPSYALISDSFRNWRGMSESGGRRIKRALWFDMRSVHLCDEAELDSFERIALVAPYVRERRAEIARYNQEHQLDTSEIVNGRRMTNLGTFRAYALAYLRAHPKIHQSMTLIVRQLAPCERGIGIELYCFTNDTAWATYEGIQADIFDHLISIIGRFGLRLFQEPTGDDLSALGRREEASPGATADPRGRASVD